MGTWVGGKDGWIDGPPRHDRRSSTQTTPALSIHTPTLHHKQNRDVSLENVVLTWPSPDARVPTCRLIDLEMARPLAHDDDSGSCGGCKEEGGSQWAQQPSRGPVIGFKPGYEAQRNKRAPIHYHRLTKTNNRPPQHNKQLRVPGDRGAARHGLGRRRHLEPRDLAVQHADRPPHVHAPGGRRLRVAGPRQGGDAGVPLCRVSAYVVYICVCVCVCVSVCVVSPPTTIYTPTTNLDLTQHPHPHPTSKYIQALRQPPPRAGRPPRLPDAAP